jgi:hypothetical protein
MGDVEPIVNKYSLFAHVLNNNYQAPCKLDVFLVELNREVIETKF